MVLDFTDGTYTTTWKDSVGQLVNALTTEGQWVNRSADMSGFAGKTVSGFYLGTNTGTPAGTYLGECANLVCRLTARSFAFSPQRVKVARRGPGRSGRQLCLMGSIRIHVCRGPGAGETQVPPLCYAPVGMTVTHAREPRGTSLRSGRQY